MKRCEEIQNLILALANPAEPTPELQAHLAHCPACRDVQRRAARLEGLIARLPVPDSSAARETLLARLEHQPQTPMRFRTRRQKVYALAGLAAAILLTITAVRVFPSRNQPVEEIAERPRHELLGQQMKYLGQLAQVNNPTDRLSIWLAWAGDVRAESRAIHKVAPAEDLALLSSLFEKAVQRGVLTQASLLPRTMPPEERRQLLNPAVLQLEETEREAAELARTAPNPARPYFLKMAQQAREASVSLKKTLNGEI
jgi:hypothetical protein